MDGQEYLEPGFDPTSLTIPRLRSILVAHNVNYPSSAKKGQLIDLFNEQVAPQARKIKAASLRVKRTSRGIENVPAREVEDEGEQEELPRPPSRGARGGRRTTRARTEEAEEVAPTPRSTRHSTAPPEGTPRRVSSKHGRTVDKVEEEQESEPKRPASRKSRLSAQTPVVKSEATDEDSPFSYDNVFQTGSSPPAQTDRRRTTSAFKDAERHRSREHRRRTEEVKPARQQMDGAVVPTRRTFDAVHVPIPRTKKEEIEPDEEFTPEEQQELVQAEHSGEVVPARPRMRKPASTTARSGVLAVLVALLGAFGTLWSQEKFEVGYCGVGQGRKEIAGVEIPEWANVVRPPCEPCPPHAICDDYLQTSCEPGFVLTPHPLTLNGNLPLPLPPTCEPDSRRAKMLDQVKQRAVEELREQNAKYECGEAATPQVKEKELKAAISSKRTKRMSNEEFEDLWQSALGDIRDADEVSTGTDGSGQFTLQSSSLAKISFSCSVSRFLREQIREYIWRLIGVLLIACSLGYGRYAITSGRETEGRAKQLAGLALEKLSLQASLHAADPNTYRENYIPMAQLRDDVLRNEFSTMSRKKLWEKVQKKVEHNSNVRAVSRESRSGDVGRVWEWIGAIGMLESPPNSNEHRRKSGRVSFGGEQWIEPSSVNSTEMSEVSRWEEGRPYY